MDDRLEEALEKFAQILASLQLPERNQTLGIVEKTLDLMLFGEAKKLKKKIKKAIDKATPVGEEELPQLVDEVENILSELNGSDPLVVALKKAIKYLKENVLNERNVLEMNA